MQIDPYSTEIRYTLDLMTYILLNNHSLSRVRIASRSVEMVKAIVRRLDGQSYSLLVENHEIATSIWSTFGLETQVLEHSSSSADAAVFPFSLEEGIQPAGEPFIVTACYNALSYKSLLYPGRIKRVIFQDMAQLRPAYWLHPYAGLYSPRSIFWWTLAKITETFNSSWHYLFQDRALRKLIDFGPLWRLSYIVVFVGRIAD